MTADRANFFEATEAPSRMERGRHRTSAFRLLGLYSIIVVALAGCGTTWEGADGQRHFIGLGHVSWTPGQDGTDTVVVGTEIVGVGVRLTGETAGLSIGYSSDITMRIGNDTMVDLTCMTCGPGIVRPRITQYPERINQ